MAESLQRQEAFAGQETPARLEQVRKLMLDGAAAEQAPLLIYASADEDPEVADHAIEALEHITAPRVADVPDFLTLLRDASGERAYWAATLLGRLGPDAGGAIGPLSNVAAEHTALPVRERATWALGQIGPAAIAALPMLEKLARETSPRLARLAQQSIDSIRG